MRAILLLFMCVPPAFPAAVVETPWSAYFAQAPLAQAPFYGRLGLGEYSPAFQDSLRMILDHRGLSPEAFARAGDPALQAQVILREVESYRVEALSRALDELNAEKRRQITDGRQTVAGMESWFRIGARLEPLLALAPMLEDDRAGQVRRMLLLADGRVSALHEHAERLGPEVRRSVEAVIEVWTNRPTQDVPVEISADPQSASLLAPAGSVPEEPKLPAAVEIIPAEKAAKATARYRLAAWRAGVWASAVALAGANMAWRMAHVAEFEPFWGVAFFLSLGAAGIIPAIVSTVRMILADQRLHERLQWQPKVDRDALPPRPPLGRALAGVALEAQAAFSLAFAAVVLGGYAGALAGAIALAVLLVWSSRRSKWFKALAQEIGLLAEMGRFNQIPAAGRVAFWKTAWKLVLAVLLVIAPLAVARIAVAPSYVGSLPHQAVPTARPQAETKDPLILRMRAARSRGAAYLLSAQNRDGSWGIGERGGTVWDTGFSRGPITAAVVEALEAEQPVGFEKASRRGTEYVFSRLGGKLAHRVWDGDELPTINMEPYSLAFGLKMLMIQYRRQQGKDKETYKQAIEGMLKVIGAADWRYSPKGGMTTFQLALLADPLIDAWNAGFDLPEREGKDVLNKILDTLQGSRLPHGGYPYHVGKYDDREGGAFRSVMIEFIFCRALRSNVRDLQRPVDVFFDNRRAFEANILAGKELRHDDDRHSWAKYFYALGVKYAAKSIRTLPSDPHRDQQARALAETLLRQQREDGSWLYSPDVEGENFATAAVLDALGNLEVALSRP